MVSEKRNIVVPLEQYLGDDKEQKSLLENTAFKRIERISMIKLWKNIMFEDVTRATTTSVIVLYTRSFTNIVVNHADTAL